ncbi:MAG: 4-phosphopantetheinyl transferase [Blastocatellia bacterium]|nr:4-phosphopantetheinyl transferase [Blastocatellia bacterium]
MPDNCEKTLISVHSGNPASVWNSPPAKMLLREQDEVHIWRASLQPSPDEIERLGHLLAPDEQSRASRFHFRKDRDHFIVARGILRSIIGRYLNTGPAQLRFDYSHYGKPSLRREFDSGSLRFSLSHSHGKALYAFARDRELGVDLEFIREDFAGEQIARKFFSTREAAQLRTLPASRRRDAFFNCWTRKEAYIKAIGQGLSMPLDEFDVSFFPGEPAALLSCRRLPQEVLRWSLQAIDVEAEYVAAVAVEGRDWRMKCWNWD